MGCAIVRDPQVFTFDEPLSNFDAKLRATMRVEIRELHHRLKTTAVYVTYDQIEAMTLANKIVVMLDGRVEQIGQRLELFDHPVDLFVAGFIGSPSMNFLEGKTAARDGKQVVLTDQGIKLPLAGVNGKEGSAVTYGMRPGHITIGEGGIAVRVSVYEPTGSVTVVFARLSGVHIDASIRGRIEGEPGKSLPFRIDPRKARIFDKATDRRLPTP